MSHIFVSYAQADRAYVDRLVAWLSRAGFDVWYDRDIATGSRWEDELRQRLESSRALLVVMTPAADASVWVAREVAYARERGKLIIPLLVREGGPILGLGDLQFEDVRDGTMPSRDFVDRLRGVAPLRRVVSHQVGLLPSSAVGFQRRPEAELLDEALAAGGIQIVSGMGGVGKTQLAGSAARRMHDAGTLDIVVWVNGQSRDAILAGFAQAAAEIVGADPADPERAAEAFLVHLSVTTARWLVIIDDLADPNDLTGLWPPGTPAGRVIVTTRRADATLSSHGRVIRVGAFSPQDALAYLFEKLNPRQQVGAAALAAELGYLPLALAQAAAYIADRDLSAADYQERLRSQQGAILEGPTWPDEYFRSVGPTVALAIEAADQLQPAGVARPLLTLLSLLDPSGIPERFVVSPPVVEFLGAATGTPADAQTARDALFGLNRLSLTDISSGDEAAGLRRIRVHTLVQRVVRSQMQDEELAATVVTAADGLLDTWPAVERDAVLAQSLRANTIALRAVGEDPLWRPDAHELLFRAGRSLGDAGLVTAAIEHFEALVQQATARLGPDNPHTLAARSNIAHWRGQSGDAPWAAAAFEGLLADCVRALGVDHHDTLATRHNLALWRGLAGDVSGAADACQALLNDHLRTLGPTHTSTLAARANLAHWRGEMGNAVGAAAAYETLLGEYLRAHGPDHPDTFTTRANLAHWRGQAGDATEAVSACEKLLVDCLRVLGPSHAQALAVRGNLAHWRGQAGNPAEAVADFDALVTDSLRVLGDEHPDTLAARANLGHWRGRTGDAAAAKAIFDALLSDYQRLHGDDLRRTFATRNSLVRWSGLAGDATSAVAAYEALLADCLRLFGEEHPNTLAVRNNLASMRARAGDISGAIEAYQGVVATCLRLFGPEHPYTLIAKGNLTRFTRLSGRG